VNDDVAGLVERLVNELGWGIGPALLCQEAASTIRALASENERLRESEREWMAVSAGHIDEAATAEAKLRKAVEVMRTAREFCESQRHDAWAQDIETKLDAFLATMEKPQEDSTSE
jgi:hypothetical protein